MSALEAQVVSVIHATSMHVSSAYQVSVILLYQHHGDQTIVYVNRLCHMQDLSMSFAAWVNNCATHNMEPFLRCYKDRDVIEIGLL